MANSNIEAKRKDGSEGLHNCRVTYLKTTGWIDKYW